ncbi:MAG: phage/plasmid primase, P4 family [Hyphomonadaceae bacterium]
MPREAARPERNPTLEAALAYTRRAWAVTPVKLGEKRPFNPDAAGGRRWQDLRPTEEDIVRWFGSTQLNVGVLLGAASGGLVDIDLDAPEAATLAGHFLPETGAIFGRAGKPRSHWLYRSSGNATRKFADPETGAMLVELRADGAQTVFPPSLHVSGEEIDWEQGGDPEDIEGANLAHAVGALAAAALLARHWPGEGGRHDAQLTLAAVLTRGGWSVDRVAWFLTCVAGAGGGDPDPVKRRATADDAARRLAGGESLRGFPTFAERFGEKIARAVISWIGLEEHFRVEHACEEGPAALRLGSHVEIARVLAQKLDAEHGGLVFAESSFWVWASTRWRALDDPAMRQAAHTFDGAGVADGRRSKRVSLTKGAIDGVLHELRAMRTNENFFAAKPPGFACGSGFLTISPGGETESAPHAPEQRQRTIFEARWRPDCVVPPGSVLGRMLASYSVIEPLLAEIVGAAAFALAPRLAQRRAIILFGPTHTGKSAILELARALIARDAHSGINPSRFNDDRQLIHLHGKALNAVDELGGAAIDTALFKQVISGEPVTGRDVYQSAVTFSPTALHLFACNAPPAFRFGFDGAMRRRVLVIPMSTTISPAECIPWIAERIAREEGELLLAWAAEGARRVAARGDFDEPECCAVAAREWMIGADPVAGWLNDPSAVQFADGALTATKEAYAAFQKWADSEGYRDPPPHAAFTQRTNSLSEKRFSYRRTKTRAEFVGLKLGHRRDR